MEGFYLRTMRYYRPDYSWLMFLVWEITFTTFFFPFWREQALELKMRITLSLSCFLLLHSNELLLFLLLCFARKIPVFHFYWHLLSSSIHLVVCFLGLGVYFNSVLSLQGKWLFHSEIYSLNYWYQGRDMSGNFSGWNGCGSISVEFRIINHKNTAVSDHINKSTNKTYLCCSNALHSQA